MQHTPQPVAPMINNPISSNPLFVPLLDPSAPSVGTIGTPSVTGHVEGVEVRDDMLVGQVEVGRDLEEDDLRIEKAVGM